MMGDDLDFQIGTPLSGGYQFAAQASLTPLVISGSETINSLAIRVISKLAHSASINASSSALVESLRSTPPLFTGTSCLSPTR